MGNDFGVGVRAEGVAARRDIVAQLLVVLDDAVVHDRDAGVADVRVRVALRRLAVRGPAGVGDAEKAGQGFARQRALQALDLADRTDPVHMAVTVEHRDARRVVAAVFQAFEAVDQDRQNVSVCNGANDTAHEAGLRESRRVG